LAAAPGLDLPFVIVDGFLRLVQPIKFIVLGENLIPLRLVDGFLAPATRLSIFHSAAVEQNFTKS
jgi:hypothetical protein